MAIKVARIEEPPAEIKGRLTPSTGNMVRTTDTFIKA
jgi:hypothetical protein